MAAPPKHSEHEYIVAQLKKYIEAYNSGYTEKMMKFMDKSNLVYSDFSGGREELSHTYVKVLFTHSFTNFHDLKIETRSLHGGRTFTAWEWFITCKAALHPDGRRLKREEAPPKKLIGCTLM